MVYGYKDLRRHPDAETGGLSSFQKKKGYLGEVSSLIHKITQMSMFSSQRPGDWEHTAQHHVVLSIQDSLKQKSLLNLAPGCIDHTIFLATSNNSAHAYAALCC